MLQVSSFLNLLLIYGTSNPTMISSQLFCSKLLYRENVHLYAEAPNIVAGIPQEVPSIFLSLQHDMLDVATFCGVRNDRGEPYTTVECLPASYINICSLTTSRAYHQAKGCDFLRKVWKTRLATIASGHGLLTNGNMSIEMIIAQNLALRINGIAILHV